MGGMFARLGAVGNDEDGSSSEGEMDQEKVTESVKLAEQKTGNKVKDVEKELKLKERELEEKEREFHRLKRRFEEERRVNERNKRRQYRMESEVRELKQKVGMWERDEEERMMRKRERIWEEKIEMSVRKRIRIEEDETEKVRQEMLMRHEKAKK